MGWRWVALGLRKRCQSDWLSASLLEAAFALVIGLAFAHICVLHMCCATQRAGTERHVLAQRRC